MMSGTSLDGVDAALIETDGARIVAFGRPATALDRNAFAFAQFGLPNFRVADGAATLSALTVAVARVVPHLPTPPRAIPR